MMKLKKSKSDKKRSKKSLKSEVEHKDNAIEDNTDEERSPKKLQKLAN